MSAAEQTKFFEEWFAKNFSLRDELTAWARELQGFHYVSVPLSFTPIPKADARTRLTNALLQQLHGKD